MYMAQPPRDRIHTLTVVKMTGWNGFPWWGAYCLSRDSVGSSPFLIECGYDRLCPSISIGTKRPTDSRKFVEDILVLARTSTPVDSDVGVTPQGEWETGRPMIPW
jgi:hypothetical protein